MDLTKFINNVNRVIRGQLPFCRLKTMTLSDVNTNTKFFCDIVILKKVSKFMNKETLTNDKRNEIYK